MHIFSELVKLYWKGKLNSNSDLNKLAEDIKKKFNFEDRDMAFIKNHIRIAMGLDPMGDMDFNDELEKIKNHRLIEQPVVTKIDGACEYCDEENCKCVDECKYSASVYKYEASVYKRSKEPIIIEGMGCNGGCVGGPRTNVEDVEKSTKFVNEFGEDSLIMTPFDNLNVMKILRQLGISSVEELTTNKEVIALLSRKRP